MEREKNVQMTFRLSADLAQDFREICASRGMKMQFIMERAVKEFVEKAKRNPE